MTRSPDPLDHTFVVAAYGGRLVVRQGPQAPETYSDEEIAYVQSLLDEQPWEVRELMRGIVWRRPHEHLRPRRLIALATHVWDARREQSLRWCEARIKAGEWLPPHRSELFDEIVRSYGSLVHERFYELTEDEPETTFEAEDLLWDARVWENKDLKYERRLWLERKQQRPDWQRQEPQP